MNFGEEYYAEQEGRETTLAAITKAINQPPLTQKPFTALKTNSRSEKMRAIWAERRRTGNIPKCGPKKKEETTEKRSMDYYDLSEVRPAPGVLCEVDGLGIPEKRIPCLLMTEVGVKADLFWGTPSGELFRIGPTADAFRLWRPMPGVVRIPNASRPIGVIAGNSLKDEIETETTGTSSRYRARRMMRRKRGYWPQYLSTFGEGETRYVTPTNGSSKQSVVCSLATAIRRGQQTGKTYQFDLETTKSAVKITRKV